MRIFLFIILSFYIWGCTTVEVTKEVIKVTNTIADKVKESVPQNEPEEQEILNETIEKKEIEQEIKKIEEKQKVDRNIVESQQKLAEINFIGKTESNIINLLGKPELSRVDGFVYTLRYNTNNCRLFLFFKNDTTNKKVEYFEIRDNLANLLNSKQELEMCYRELKLIN